MSVLTMLKISENNGMEEIGLVTPTPGPGYGQYDGSVQNCGISSVFVTFYQQLQICSLIKLHFSKWLMAFLLKWPLKS